MPPTVPPGRPEPPGERFADRLRGPRVPYARASTSSPVAVAQDLPPAPSSLEATGLPTDFVVDLLLKHVLRRGQPTLAQLAERTALPLPLIEPVLAHMRHERLVEVPRRGDVDSHVAFALTDRGRQHAVEAQQRCQYSGPAPVTLADYVDRVTRQRVIARRITETDLRRSLHDMVVDESLYSELGAAVNSDRAIFIYGPSGSGKTFLAEHLADLVGGGIAVPHAILVDDQVIQVYDPAVHIPDPYRQVEVVLDRSMRADARWVACKRPVVRLGGELTLSMLDLEFDPLTRYYRAPAQLKANNGVLVLDDLGRQRTPVHEILNRWIVPLDRRVDYLSLHTGTKFDVPFDMTVVFSSNQSPAALDDPAFVRRLGYKIYIGELTEAMYRKVFAMACHQVGIGHDPSVEDMLVRDLHGATGTPLMAAYPADLLMKIRNRAVFAGEEPVLTIEGLRWAWRLYFAPDREEFGNGETGGVR